MRKFFIILLLVVAFSVSSVPAFENNPFNYEIKTLYQEPSENSQVVFQIPIEVKLLNASLDGNWYKVKIDFGVGPIRYNYVGWTKIPISDILLR